MHTSCSVSRDVCFFLFRQVKCIDQMFKAIKSTLNQRHYWCKDINGGQPMVFGSIDSSVRWLLKTLSIWSILFTSLSRVGINIWAHIKWQVFDVTVVGIKCRVFIFFSVCVPWSLSTQSKEHWEFILAQHERDIGKHGMETSSCLSPRIKNKFIT